MRQQLSIFLVTWTIVIAGCTKNANKSSTMPPDKATLTFPAQSSACTTGVVVSATQSTITFTWNTSSYTDNYELDVKNLITGSITTQITTGNTLAVTLQRDMPYSWYIVSKSNSVSTTAQSDTWKFYNAGPGTVSHPPFPADALTPTFNQNITATAGTINLSWTGSDPDNDIAGYDIYFGTTATPPLFKANVTNMFLNGVPVSAGNTYYWKVITHDAAGNTSDSGTFQFKVN